MKIKYLSELGLIPLLLWLMTACTTDLEHPLDEKGQDSGTEIPINILPKLSVGLDTRLSKLRVIIFSTRNSKPYDPKVLISNELVDVNKDYTTITYAGYNDIYVIGNEPVDLSGVKSPDDLKTIRMNAESSPTTVLYKQLLNVRVKSKDEIYLDGETSSVSKLEIKLQHVMAKLSVDFDLSTEVMEGGTTSTGVHLDFESMEIAYIPKSIGLIPQKYDSDQGYLDNLSFSLKNTSTIANRFTWFSGEIYLPEHLIGNNDYRTILRIKGKANSVTHIYTLPVGDAMNSVDSHSTEWNVTRNRHYKLTIRAITGYGEELLEASARVAGWSEINVPIEIPGASFIALGTNEIDVKSIRFFTYTRFVCSDEVKVKYPDGVTIANQLSMAIEYDDETKKSGRIGFKKGNWNAASDMTYTATLMSGMASVKLNLKLYKTALSGLRGPDNWASAMGYPGSANTTKVGIYNAALYKKQSTRTGCNDYYETSINDPVKGQGCWRLATIAENQASNGVILWCIEEDTDAKNAYLAGKNYFGSTEKGKSNTYYCALDVRPPELSDFIVSDVDIKDISKDEAAQICTDMGSGWRLPTGKETDYVFKYAGTNGLPNNFFSDSYWGKENDTFIVATIPDPDGSGTTDELRNQAHTVRCVKSRY